MALAPSPGPTRIGVLGGGQLGRMLGLAGIPLGARFTFFDPSPESPARAVGDLVVGSYEDRAALDRFIDDVDVVTFEFENVPTHAAEYVASKRPVWPPVGTLRVAQDRVHEKTYFTSLGIPTAPFVAVDTRDALERAVAELGPGILKTRTLGYDGKGQVRIGSAESSVLSDEIDTAWDAVGGVPLIYEQLVRFRRELSIIGVRGRDGTMVCYPLVENTHRGGILRLSLAPAPDVREAMQQEAEEYLMRVMRDLGYVGVLAIELFEPEASNADVRTGAGAMLYANEMAPRVHNSGHWTIEGAETSQFENHIRAVCGLPLGSTALVGYSAMLNLIGTTPSADAVLTYANTHLHLYDKRAAPGRKLGHVTVRAADPDTVQARVREIHQLIATS